MKGIDPEGNTVEIPAFNESLNSHWLVLSMEA